MDRTVEHLTDVDQPTLHGVVGDLTTYPDWLDIVDRVHAAPADRDDAGPAYWVTLRARIGRLTRAKRLRMVAHAVDDTHLVIRRRELDDRRHSDWILDVRTSATDRGSRLEMTLTYTGGLFEPVVGRLLDAEIGRSRPRLDALLTA